MPAAEGPRSTPRRCGSSRGAHLRTLIVAALDTGMRRGEMLALTWADIDAKPGWLRLRGETTKSGRTRWVPVSTGRLKAVLDFQRVAADGESKASGRCSLQQPDR